MQGNGRGVGRGRGAGSIVALLSGVIVAGGGAPYGCANAGQGAVSGAGIGALSGLAIGSLSGDAGAGAAIGAVVGGVGGAVIGDQNRRRSEAPATASSASTPAGGSAPALSQADRDRLALAKLARSWDVHGWETVDGERRSVSGTAVGSVENSYFVRIDMSMSDDKSGATSAGNIVFGSEPGQGLTMTSRYNTSPSAISYAGRVSDDGDVFTLDENGSHSTGKRIVIRFLSDDEFVADVIERQGGRSTPRASLTFAGNR